MSYLKEFNSKFGARFRSSLLTIGLMGVLLELGCEESSTRNSEPIGYEALFHDYLKPSCSQEACHGGEKGVADLRFVDVAESYEQLIQVSPTNGPAHMAGLKRVMPNSVDQSYLWLKLASAEAELSQRGYGALMPMSSGTQAGPNTLSLIREWIEAGAPLKGSTPMDRGIQIDTSPRAGGDLYVQCDFDHQASEEELRSCFADSQVEGAIRLYTPPLTIPPRSEILLCSYLKMPIDAPLFVNRTLGQQMNGGHHAAVFLAVSPSDEGPHECRDEEMSNFRFAAGAGGGGGQDTQLPSGVALKIEPGQQFVIQSHYLNPTDDPLLVMDAVDLVTLPENEVLAKVDPFALIHGGFEIPPSDEPFEVRKRCRLEQDIDVYMLLGHTHDYGILFEFYHHSQLTGEPRQLYRATDGPLLRDNPEIKYYDPPLPMLAGDEVEMRCLWENDSGAPLGWPEEMCVALMYYGPGLGWMTCDEDDETPNLPSSSTDEGCVQPGAMGNELGVGRECSPSGGECIGAERATLCLATFDARANFCSFLGCQTDADCGQGAHCLAQGPSTACVPAECSD